MAFDFDLFVIGAGSGGVRAARFAAPRELHDTDTFDIGYGIALAG